MAVAPQELEPKSGALKQPELKRTMEPSSNHFAVRKTFLELQDSLCLKEWCGSMRRVKSCPDLTETHPVQSEPIPPTPEVSPRAEKSMAPDELQPTAPRTRLSSQAVPFRPPMVAHSTTYYAVPSVPRGGQEPQPGTLPAAVLSVPPTLTAVPTPMTFAQSKPVPPVPQVILGSPMLPSIGSGGHATGECKPCVFFHKKGCATGRTCLFCHLCQPGEKQRRKQEKSQRRLFSTSVSCVAHAHMLQAFSYLTPPPAHQGKPPRTRAEPGASDQLVRRKLEGPMAIGCASPYEDNQFIACCLVFDSSGYPSLVS